MALYETASYEVLKEYDKHMELRKYPVYYLAQTTSQLDTRYSNGFGTVFNYISGNNETSEKISMTTPVISQVENNTLRTSFVVPSKYKGNPPVPSSGDVQIKVFSEGYYIVIRFKGGWNDKTFTKYNDLLLNKIHQEGLKVLSEAYILRYQPPFIPNFLKRNEIMYLVKVLAYILLKAMILVLLFLILLLIHPPLI